jgi:flagellar basal-body rod protein FlgC
MSTFTAMDIAASALSVQRTRMAIVASNLANVESTRDPQVAGPYRRRELVVQATPLADFTQVLREELGARDDAAEEVEGALRGVTVSSIELDPSPPMRVYNPGHPDADAQGYVAMPNISVMREMADMMAAARAYEANLATLRTVRDMATSALEIGRS